MKKITRKSLNFFGGIFRFFDRILITPIMKVVLKIKNVLTGNGKSFEKIISSKKALLIISLLIAFGVFYFFDKNSSSMLNNHAERLYGIPVKAVYNEEAYVIEGLPETADVILFGNSSYITLAKQYPNPTISVDLRELSVGTHKVALNYEKYFDFVEYKIDPTYVTVVIRDKVSSTRELSYEILHREALSGKLDITNVTLNKSEVTIKSDEDTLKNVAYVKALIDVNLIVNPEVGKTSVKGSKLVAYDEDGRVVDVEILPETVDAEVTLASSSKMVPIKVVPEGNLAVGYAIDTITPSSSSIMIYGSEEALAKIDAIPVTINVNGLNADKTFNVNIQKPNGVRELGINSLSVKLTVTSEQQEEIKGVQVSTINLDPSLKVQAVNEASSSVDVIVKGSESAIKELDKSKVTATIDLAEYKKPGEYEVPVIVTGEDPRLVYSSKTLKVKIRIYK